MDKEAAIERIERAGYRVTRLRDETKVEGYAPMTDGPLVEFARRLPKSGAGAEGAKRPERSSLESALTHDSRGRPAEDNLNGP